VSKLYDLAVASAGFVSLNASFFRNYLLQIKSRRTP